MKIFNYIAIVTVLGCAQTWAEGTAVAASAATTNAPASYMRMVENPTNGTVSLQFASRHLVPVSGKGPGIWLVGTGHIAEKSYYQETQAFLDTIPVVLFEDAGLQYTTNTVNDASANLSAEDKAMRARYAMFPTIAARQFGLVCQPASIDYLRPNFQFCDLTHAEIMAALEKSMGKRPELGMMAKNPMPQPKSTWVTKETKAVLDKIPRTATAQQMTARLNMMEGSTCDTSPEAQDPPGMKGYNAVAIGLRNAHLLAKIKELAQAPKPAPELALFYGAGHMPIVERDLCAALGYKAAEEKWATGFSVSPESLNLSINELRLLRAFIHQQTLEQQKALAEMNANAPPSK